MNIENNEYEDAFNEITDGESHEKIQDAQPDAADFAGNEADDQGQRDSDADVDAGADSEADSGTEEIQTVAAKPDEKPEEKVAEPESIDSLKRKLDELTHKERSVSGRISSYQKKINELEKQVQANQSKVLEALASGDESFREDFPDIAKAMDAKLAAVAKAIEDQTIARLQPLREAEEERHRAREMAALESAHPTWQDDVKSESFKNWIATQPQQVASLAHSDSAADASALITLFKQATQSALVHSEPAPAKDTSRARLEKAQGVQSRAGKPTRSSIPDDFNSAFEYFSKQG